MQRVLVTGATGFIGRWTLHRLQSAGFEVHAVTTRVNPGLDWASEYNAVFFHTCDLLDHKARRELLSRINASHLLHLAWNVKPGYWSSLDNYRWTSASLDLLAEFHARGGSRAVLAGTCAEYDWSVADICDESATPSVLSNARAAKPYAVCKASLRRLATSFASASGLSLAWGCVFFQYGPFEHESRLIPSIILGLLSGSPVECSHGRQVRDFLYITDVADAFVAILASEMVGSVNIGSGEAITLSELIHDCAALIGRVDLLRMGARQVDPGEPAVLLPNVHRLRDELGWHPRVTLASGLGKTIDWWRNRKSTTTQI